MIRPSALAALFGAGLLFAFVVPAVGSAEATTAMTFTESTQVTTTEQVTTTIQQTTTAPATTVVTTATVAPTSTSETFTGTATATSSGTPTWVWILVAALGAAVIGLVVFLVARRGSGAMPEAERRRRLQAAIDSWTAQGWALLSESADSAVLQRGTERMTVTVDASGQIGTRAMTPPPPGEPPGRWPE